MFYELAPDGLQKAMANCEAHRARLNEFHARGRARPIYRMLRTSIWPTMVRISTVGPPPWITPSATML